MARKGKKVNKEKFKPLYAHRFNQFLQPANAKSGKKKFLGFPINPVNNNQLWRWDTLEEVKM